MSAAQGKDWRESDKVTLREVEQRARENIDGLEEFAITLDNDIVHEDTRDYCDRIFKDFSTAAGISNKTVRGIKCEGGGGPAKFPEGTIAVLFDYKVKKTQGKRDPVAGNHVLLMQTPKGPIMLPLQIVKRFALNMIRVMDGIEDEFAEMEIPLELPKTEG